MRVYFFQIWVFSVFYIHHYPSLFQHYLLSVSTFCKYSVFYYTHDFKRSQYVFAKDRRNEQMNIIHGKTDKWKEAEVEVMLD